MCIYLYLRTLPSAFQDPFKYSYPPLPDDDFQMALCDNGPVASEDETESKEADAESRDALESSFNSEVAVKPKKVHFVVFLKLCHHLININSLAVPHIITPAVIGSSEEVLTRVT